MRKHGQKYIVEYAGGADILRHEYGTIHALLRHVDYIGRRPLSIRVMKDNIMHELQILKAKTKRGWKLGPCPCKSEPA